jgi:hypothetical protein
MKREFVLNLMTLPFRRSGGGEDAQRSVNIRAIRVLRRGFDKSSGFVIQVAKLSDKSVLI